jgi:lysophospholipase L1-like esterase
MIRALPIVVMLACSSALATIDVAWVGDSITESDAADGYTIDPPGKLCEFLNGQSCSVSGTNLRFGGNGKLYSGATHTVRNLGYSGQTITSTILSRYCTNVVAGGDYEYVIILGATNDMCTPKISAARIMEDYSSMLLDAYRFQGAVVAALSVLPRGGASCWDGTSESIRGSLRTLLLAWVAAHPGSFFVDLEPYFDANGDDVMDVGLHNGDLTHLSATGVDLLAARVACDVFAVGC